MSEKTPYFSSLKNADKRRYVQKLSTLYDLPIDEEYRSERDPYESRKEEWHDDIALWPSLEFPSVYSYLVDTPGEFTREKLKAFKSLEAHNYYIKYVTYKN